jgi:ATP-dependent Lon protease
LPVSQCYSIHCSFGLFIQVGGIKDKVLAAHRAGLKRVILPKKNEKDLHEVPENVKVMYRLL